MLTKIIMPSSGQTTNESLIVKWHKKIGDEVKRGDVLFEIETDKATMEVESYAEGYLLSINYNEGEYVSSGEIVSYIGAQGEKIPNDSKRADVPEEDEYQPILKTEKVVEEKTEVKGNVPSNEKGKVLASPAARQKAKDKNVKIEDVYSASDKQVVKHQDVVEYLKTEESGSKEEYYHIATSNMRKVIARRMQESVSTAPCFTVSMDVDVSGSTALRKTLNGYLKDEGIKVSFNDIIMKCASKAVEKFPMINSTYGEDKIKVYKNVNFGLAVGIEGGLVVPVVRETNNKSISQIARENMINIDNAKSNKLPKENMSGGTITLSNLGMFGVDNFTAIINQPESCILAVGQIAEKPVSINGQILSKQMMTITASFDHRNIDGAIGAAFLRELKILLESPELILA